MPWQDGQAFPWPRSESSRNSFRDLDSSHQGQWLLCWPRFLGSSDSPGTGGPTQSPCSQPPAQVFHPKCPTVQATLCTEEIRHVPLLLQQSTVFQKPLVGVRGAPSVPPSAPTTEVGDFKPIVGGSATTEWPLGCLLPFLKSGRLDRNYSFLPHCYDN